MLIKIQIVSVDVTTKPTKNGSYQQATVAYRDLGMNKIAEKKIMSFTDEGKAIFTTATSAQKDQIFTVEKVKEGEYNVWKSMVQEAPGMQQTSAASSGYATAPAGSKFNQTASSPRTYESAEERAERQVLIVRQSSLSAAVATLTAGAKNPPKPEDVLALAETYNNYVFQKEAKAAFSETGFEDIPNDL